MLPGGSRATYPARSTNGSKIQTVALAESIGPAKAAQQFDVSVTTLANWAGNSRASKPLSESARQPVGEFEAELARLRADNATRTRPYAVTSSTATLRAEVFWPSPAAQRPA